MSGTAEGLADNSEQPDPPGVANGPYLSTER
jgi:hypothetical protein